MLQRLRLHAVARKPHRFVERDCAVIRSGRRDLDRAYVGVLFELIDRRLG